MRISDRMMANQTIQYMNENRDRLSELQTLISSGKLYQTASDNPVQVSSILTLKSTIRTSENYLDTANYISSWMDTSDLAFKQQSDVLIRAVNLMQRGLSDTMTADERKNALAPEMDTILDQLLNVANTSYQGQYIFAGHQINTKPYELSKSDPNVVEYHGDSGLMQHEIGTGQNVTTNINNSAVFQGMFNAVIRARNALINNDRAEMTASMTDLNTAQTGVGDIRATNGARSRQVDNAITHLEKSNLALKNLLSKKEDVNMAEAIVNMRNQETTYQAVLEVGQRAISALNLFDVLR